MLFIFIHFTDRVYNAPETHFVSNLSCSLPLSCYHFSLFLPYSLSPILSQGSGPEDFSHLPPEQRRKKLQAKIDDLNKDIQKEMDQK